MKQGKIPTAPPLPPEVTDEDKRQKKVEKEVCSSSYIAERLSTLWEALNSLFGRFVYWVISRTAASGEGRGAFGPAAGAVFQIVVAGGQAAAVIASSQHYSTLPGRRDGAGVLHHHVCSKNTSRTGSGNACPFVALPHWMLFRYGCSMQPHVSRFGREYAAGGEVIDHIAKQDHLSEKEVCECHAPGLGTSDKHIGSDEYEGRQSLYICDGI